MLVEIEIEVPSLWEFIGFWFVLLIFMIYVTAIVVLLSDKNKRVRAELEKIRSSSRISGNEGALEQIWAFFCLHGLDGFGIDPFDFQAMKSRSVDFSGKLVSNEYDVENNELCVGGEVLDDSLVSSLYLVIDPSNEFDVKLRNGVLEDGELCSEVVREVVLTGGGRSGGVGIRDERPPAVLLSPPPSMSLPVVDISQWNIKASDINMEEGGGFFFAVKEVSLLDQGDKGREIIYQFEQETAFLSQFEHKNIVRYLGTDKDDLNLYIFLELAFGSLLSLYQRYRFQDSHVSGYTRQILEGLKYLHERSVVHRDIKCANILLDVDGNAKLADFGLAKVNTLNDAKSCKGTAYWMAPEVVQPNKGYGCPADIWSLGCTVLEMLTQNFPYHPLNGYQAMYQIGSGQPPPVPNFLSKDARDFILKCLQVDPETRPSAVELLEHPFVKKPHPGSTSPHHHGMQA